MKHTHLLLLFVLGLVAQANGQHTQNHNVYFRDVEGFSGRVEFTSSREGFATQLRGKHASLYISDYKCSDEEKAALEKAGVNLWWYYTDVGYQPKTFGVVVQGKAYVQEQYYYHESLSNDKLKLSQGLGDFTTPEFDEEVQAHATKYQQTYKTSYWEDHGGFDAKEVTALYLADLKYEINKVLDKYENTKNQFSVLIAQAESAAQKYDFANAESALAKTSALTDDNREWQVTVAETEALINDKKEEKEEKKEKAEKEAETKKKTAASGGSSGSSSKEKSDKKDKDSDKKESKRKTLQEYAYEEANKGDWEMQRGNYKKAAKYYENAKSMGAYVDDDKYETALAGSAATSLKELFSYIPEEDETVSSFTLSYYNKNSFWRRGSFGWTPESHWGNFFIQWGFFASYTKGKMWINQQKEGTYNTSEGIGYDSEQTFVFEKNILNNISSNEILFSRENDDYTEYAIFEEKEFESFGGGLQFGLGYRIPIASQMEG